MTNIILFDSESDYFKNNQRENDFYNTFYFEQNLNNNDISPNFQVNNSFSILEINSHGQLENFERFESLKKNRKLCQSLQLS